ncbi:MAG: hypothetical protein VKK62_01010 [Synechococcaceae cyanobacterium]|nr:hypothetical protein [Synechococcaceae cyanobacterium]
MTAPVPWSLAWREDGELAPQDLFDLLQTLVCCESESAQPSLVYAVERLAMADVTVLSSRDVSELCA